MSFLDGQGEDGGEGEGEGEGEEVEEEEDKGSSSLVSVFLPIRGLCLGLVGLTIL